MAAIGKDRRIVRTNKALRAALIALTEERGLDAITVNDLCECADINRGTFYNHYRDKDDLLNTLENDLFAGLEGFQAKLEQVGLLDLAAYRAGKRPLPALAELFDYLRAQGDFLHAMLGPQGDPSFAPRLRDCVCTHLVRAILHERYRESDDPFVGYYVAFFASVYPRVIAERWIDGMRESSKDMALIAMRLLFIKPGESIKL